MKRPRKPRKKLFTVNVFPDDAIHGEKETLLEFKLSINMT